MHASALVFVAFLSALVAPAWAQPANVVDLLSDPKYAPFIQTVIAEAAVCLTEPAILGGDFELGDCPGLNNLLDDVYNNVTDPKITCEQSCNDAFALLSEACNTALRDAFDIENEKYGEYAVKFFEICDSEAVAETPTQAPTEEEEQAEDKQESSLTPAPTATPAPATPSSLAAASAPTAILFLAFNAAVLFI